MTAPKISVCVVTYNHEPYIAQALDGALTQETTFPVEIVVGEDCSTDGTREIVDRIAARFPDRIRVLATERNLGAKANFMRTFAECRAHARYTAMLEGDDYWTSPQKLQQQVDALDAEPGWAMCFHPAACVYLNGSRSCNVWPYDWDRREGSLLDLFNVNFIATGSVVYRNGLFPELPAWFADSFIGDWPLHMLHAAHGNIGFLSEIMSVYRVHSTGIWSGMSRADRLAKVFKMFSLVDHHFAGQYAREIDAYRLRALSQLIDEANAAADAVAAVPVLRAEIEQLATELRELAAAHETLQHSLPLVIAREAARPFKQLQNLLHRAS